MSFKGLRMLKIPKLPDFEKYWKISENIQRGDPWNLFLVFFLTLYFTQDNHTRLLECHLEVLECWKAQNWPNVTHSPLWLYPIILEICTHLHCTLYTGIYTAHHARCASFYLTPTETSQGLLLCISVEVS